MLVKQASLRTEVVVHAPPERVWHLLKSCNWQQFNEFLAIRPSASLAPGTNVSMTFTLPGRAPATVQPKVITYHEQQELRWLGRLGSGRLFRSEHYLKVQALPGGRTLLLHGEDFKGWLVPLLGDTLDATAKGFQAFNAGLKRAAEAANHQL